MFNDFVSHSLIPVASGGTSLPIDDEDAPDEDKGDKGVVTVLTTALALLLGKFWSIKNLIAALSSDTLSKLVRSLL